MRSFNYKLTIIILIAFTLGFILPTAYFTLTKENIEHAEKILGIDFTDAERDSMLSTLQERLANYKKIREYGLDNSVVPALQFNPIPVGADFSNIKNQFIVTDYSYAKLPANKDDLAFYSIGELAFLLKTKKITSLELTKFFLERLKKFDKQLFCVVTLTEELALKQAAQADSEIKAGNYKGLLHGIPYGVKDLLTTKGYKTTWGSPIFKDQLINEDAEVVKRLTKAGAVLCAKLSMGELAWGDVWFGGQTRSPWNLSVGSSGSSAGSASSVSAGLLPFAIGTETWGSIVSPSTMCGTTGLRPTYGRVSRTGAMALSWSMDKIGPICRTAEDCAIVFNAIYGPDNIDQTLVNLPFDYNAKLDVKKIKVGYIKKDFKKKYDFKENDEKFMNTLREMGIELIPIELPDVPVNDIALILEAEAGAAFQDLIISNNDNKMVRQIKNAWPNVFRNSMFIPAAEYINANRIRQVLINKMVDIFKKVDVYLAPSFEGDNLLLTNLTGHPALVLPTGFNNGMPTTITINGNLYEEGKIITLGKKFQEATNHHKQQPPLK